MPRISSQPRPVGGMGAAFFSRPPPPPMPEFFRNAPIQRKLMLIILGSYAAAKEMGGALIV